MTGNVPISHVDGGAVAARVADIRTRIADAVGPTRDVELMAVTKGFGADALTAAVAAGCPMIGENYAQELLAKVSALGVSGLSNLAELDVRLHFIGNLQSNKVRQLAGIVGVWESVDRSSLLDEIAKRSPGATVLIQVNASGEPAKGGCRPDSVAGLVRHGVDLDLDVDGVMTVGPTNGDPVTTRQAFALASALASDLGLPTCSMGMTHDLDIALECGTTRVRLGTALFGPRS